MNDESFKIDPKNKPRIFSNVMSMKEEKRYSAKVSLRFVIIERKINVRRGQFKQIK